MKSILKAWNNMKHFKPEFEIVFIPFDSRWCKIWIFEWLHTTGFVFCLWQRFAAQENSCSWKICKAQMHQKLLRGFKFKALFQTIWQRRSSMVWRLEQNEWLEDFAKISFLQRLLDAMSLGIEASAGLDPTWQTKAGSELLLHFPAVKNFKSLILFGKALEIKIFDVLKTGL